MDNKKAIIAVFCFMIFVAIAWWVINYGLYFENGAVQNLPDPEWH